MTTEHFHADDYPLTIKILIELLARRVVSGFVPLPRGAIVDWWALEHCGLSSSEKATVEIARGISIIERCGGFPGLESVARAIAEAVENLR
jgi:hypothetical protein